MMDFVSVRVITDDIKRLVRFYEEITGLSATWSTDDFSELATVTCTLAIGTKRTIEMFGMGAARAADNHTAIIEFRVGDVDKEYEKLGNVIRDFSGRRLNRGETGHCCFATLTGIGCDRNIVRVFVSAY